MQARAGLLASAAAPVWRGAACMPWCCFHARPHTGALLQALKEGKEETTYKKGAPESASPAASGDPAGAAGRSTDPAGAGA